LTAHVIDLSGLEDHMPKHSQLDPQKVAQSFRELAVSAAELNIASDELTRAIAPIDAALTKVNLGVEVWHEYAGGQESDGDYWSRSIGYARVDGKWGLALSAASGNVQYETDSQTWLFNNAPRSMRLEALEHVPALLDTLVKQVSQAASDLKKKTELAHELATTISAVAAHLPERR
jgi:hypothetical protein